MAVAALVCVAIAVGDPRPYEGPTAAPGGDTQIDPFAGVVAQEDDIDEIARRLPALRAAPAPPEPAVQRPHAGRGLLIAGGIFAGTGLVLSTLGTALGGVITSLVAPAPWVVAVPLLGGGMQRRNFDLAARKVDEEGRAVAPPRRGVFAAGVTMATVGTAAMIATWPIGLIGVYATWAAGPLAISGAMMAGAARGKTLGRKARITVAPLVTRNVSLVSIAGRW